MDHVVEAIGRRSLNLFRAEGDIGRFVHLLPL
jgi:hypothetical protein